MNRISRSIISLCLVAALAGSVWAITWCHDYTYFVITGRDSNRLQADGLRKALSDAGYRLTLTLTPLTANESSLLRAGDVLIFNEDHSGVVTDDAGHIDHFLQMFGTTLYNSRTYTLAEAQSIYDPVLQSPLLRRGWTLKQIREYRYPAHITGTSPPPKYANATVQVWRKRLICTGRGPLLARVSLPANKSEPTNTGIVLEKGRPYIVVGEGVISLWDGQNDGCDSVYRYRSPLETNGGAKVIWGQLKLINPTIHLADLIEKETGKKPDYNPSNVYASVVYGEGLPLQALVYDAGSYADNHNALTINVYDCTLSGGVGASTGLAPTVTTGGLSGTINQATVYGLGTALGQAELSAWQNGDRNYVIQNLNAARQAAAALRLPTDGLDAVLGQLQRGATPATIYAQLASVRQGIEQISNKTCNCGVAANPLYTLSVGLQLGFAEIVAWQNGDRNYLAQQLNYARQNAAASGLSVQRLEYALSLLKAGYASRDVYQVIAEAKNQLGQQANRNCNCG